MRKPTLPDPVQIAYTFNTADAHVNDAVCAACFISFAAHTVFIVVSALILLGCVQNLPQASVYLLLTTLAGCCTGGALPVVSRGASGQQPHHHVLPFLHCAAGTLSLALGH